jgi:hypothetical protein
MFRQPEGRMSEIRKLAAILVADVVGYSRLAGADEDRTLARLRGLRSDLIDPAIAAHHGRIVKRTGDGSIIEFRSVVDWVQILCRPAKTLECKQDGGTGVQRFRFVLRKFGILCKLRVFTHAKAMGHETASVGDLRDHMRHLFPPVKGEKQHFKALDYAAIPAFVRELHAAQRQGEAISPALIAPPRLCDGLGQATPTTMGAEPR